MRASRRDRRRSYIGAARVAEESWTLSDPAAVFLCPILVSYDVSRLAERGCPHGSDITPHVNVITYVSRDFLNM